MLYEKALRQLAALELPLAAAGSRLTADEYEAALDDLVASKFTYVVSSQVRKRSYITPSQIRTRNG
jgi:hypothetical protein